MLNLKIQANSHPLKFNREQNSQVRYNTCFPPSPELNAEVLLHQHYKYSRKKQVAKTEVAVKVSNRWTRTGITAICCKLPDLCSFPGTQTLFVSERAGVDAGSFLFCWGSTCPSLCFGARHWEEKSRSFPGSDHGYHSLEQKAQCCLLASSYSDLPGCTESILIYSDKKVLWLCSSLSSRSTFC